MLKRINHIDIIKALGIILVIIGHLHFANNSLHSYIYSFHMPLFFLCYGMSNKHREYNFNTTKSLIISRFKSLYIPYFLWALIYAKLDSKNILYILYGSHVSLASINGSLWFLPCFLVSIILFELINFILYSIKSNKKFNNFTYFAVTIFSIVLSIMLPNFSKYGYPLGINISFMGLAFIIIGKYLEMFIQNYEIEKLKPKYLVAICLILFIGTFKYKLNPVSYVLMAENRYGNILLFLATAIIGCMLISFISILIDKTLLDKFKNKIIFIGQNTLIIFAAQRPMIIFLYKLFSKIPIKIPNILILTFGTIFILVLCTIIIKISERYIPELSGKISKKIS